MPLIALGEIQKLNKLTVQCLQYEDFQFVLIHRENNFYLLDNLCPHKAAALCDGDLIGDEIVCPWHKARFDIHSGKGLTPLAGDGVVSYHISEVDGQLMVELP
jgi:3-phenylpropionate/trans-cinnamate dioxygenase ferredoxin component